MNTHTISLSDGSSYVADLVVYRDFTQSNGKWRLFWQNPGTSCGVNEQSTVTGQPFFRTMREAIAHGERRYGITATRADFLKKTSKETTQTKMTTKSDGMTTYEQKVIDAAKRVAGDRAEVTMHRGDKDHRAIRLSGCLSDEASSVAWEIEDAIDPLCHRHGYPAVRIAPGFVAVWFR